MDTGTLITRYFGKDLLNELINVSGLTKEEFSKHIGVSDKIVSEWLNNKQALSLARLIIFAEKLECNIKFSITKK